MTDEVNMAMGTGVKIGQHYAFRYCFAENSNTTMPELLSRHGMCCLVLKLEEPSVIDGCAVFLVRFMDGHQNSAFASELEDSEVLTGVINPEPKPPKITALVTYGSAIDELRSLGFAVVLFNPEELRGAEPRRVESRLVELGNEVIHDLKGL